MTELKYNVPSVGEKVTVAEPTVDTALTKIAEFINGNNLDGTKNIKAEGVLESNLVKSVQEKLTSKVGLTVVKQTVSAEGSTENLYLMETNGNTLTLPAATANRFIGVTCANGVAAVKVKASAGKIYGDFINGETEVTLTENQHIFVEADGANWRIVAGEAKRTGTYSKTGRLYATEYEPSASRPVQVTVYGTAADTVTPVGSCSFLCPPTQKWAATKVSTTKATVAIGAELVGVIAAASGLELPNVSSSYLTL